VLRGDTFFATTGARGLTAALEFLDRRGQGQVSAL
jgi:hypothetical protein